MGLHLLQPDAQVARGWEEGQEARYNPYCGSKWGGGRGGRRRRTTNQPVVS